MKIDEIEVGALYGYGTGAQIQAGEAKCVRAVGILKEPESRWSDRQVRRVAVEFANDDPPQVVKASDLVEWGPYAPVADEVRRANAALGRVVQRIHEVVVEVLGDLDRDAGKWARVFASPVMVTKPGALPSIQFKITAELDEIESLIDRSAE